MIVYADQSWRTSIRDLVASLVRRIEIASGPVSIEETRVRLVLAGQVEQAVCDADSMDCAAATAKAVTRLVAQAFVRRRAAPSGRYSFDWPAVVEHLAWLVKIVGAREAVVRTPEGFSGYGLSPDASAEIAETWLQRHGAALVDLACETADAGGASDTPTPAKPITRRWGLLSPGSR